MKILPRILLLIAFISISNLGIAQLDTNLLTGKWQVISVVDQDKEILEDYTAEAYMYFYANGELYLLEPSDSLNGTWAIEDSVITIIPINSKNENELIELDFTIISLNSSKMVFRIVLDETEYIDMMLSKIE